MSFAYFLAKMLCTLYRAKSSSTSEATSQQAPFSGFNVAFDCRRFVPPRKGGRSTQKRRRLLPRSVASKRKRVSAPDAYLPPPNCVCSQSEKSARSLSFLLLLHFPPTALRPFFSQVLFMPEQKRPPTSPPIRFKGVSGSRTKWKRPVLSVVH